MSLQYGQQKSSPASKADGNPPFSRKLTMQPDKLEAMLPPFIIQQINERERNRAPPQERPVLDIPEPLSPKSVRREDDADRGCTIVDFDVNISVI